MVAAADTRINPDVCVKAGALKAISLDVEAPGKRGGLNGSLQHLLKVFLYESTRLNSFAGVN